MAVKVDAETGQLPTASTEKTRTEYFTDGTQPTKGAVKEIKAKICIDSGYLATPDCPNTTKIKYYEGEATDEDGNPVPQYYCNMHNTDTEAYPIDPIYIPEPDNPEDPSTDDDDGGEIIDDPDDPNYNPQPAE